MQGRTCHGLEQRSWSSPSVSPSPPPPPLPRPAVTRWTRTEQNSCDACPHCRTRLASFPTRTTSLSSYSGCKERSTPIITRPPDDEDSFPVLYDRELHSLHRNIPALRRRDVDTNAIKQHYYPEGGWGWLVCGASFLAHLLTSGLQLAYGLLHLYVMQYLVKRHQDKELYQMAAAWMGALCLSISFLTSPFVVAASRRKSTRITAVFGGLLLALSSLFASFAMQFHQALLSYGLVLGTGAGIVRETSGLILGHYFKQRREFVELIAQTGTGVGMALFSVLYKEAVGKLGWRFGMQAVTGLLSLAFFLPLVYRSANLYHPQRRAITHLKNQRKKVKEKKTHIKVKKPPMFDFTPLRSRGLRVLLVASATGALGIYSPLFYLILQGHKEGLEDSALVLLQTFMGFASALGFVGFGLVIIKPSTQCLISRQYLCQAAMIGIGISLLALSVIQGYHGYVLFVWLYGVCLGGFSYSLKMFTLERIRARHFNKAWGFVQGAKSIPVLLGVPITGYINQLYPKYGYYFGFCSTIIGAGLMFLVGTKKEHNSANDIHNYALTNCNSNMNECTCNFKYSNAQISCSYPVCKLRPMYYLPKSLSYAANIEYPDNVKCISHGSDYGGCRPVYRHHNNLRPTRSVPEGLARCGSLRRPIRDIQVIEQITTSV